MTGQVKEEILTRFGELGVRVDEGIARFEPALLRPCEFMAQAGTFRYLAVDGNWQQIERPADSLAFTWCQVPILYRLDDTTSPTLTVIHSDGGRQALTPAALGAETSQQLFGRSGIISRLELSFPRAMLFDEA